MMTYAPDRFTDDAEATAHRRMASDVFDLDFDPSVPVQAERNVLSLISPDASFGQRLDCRTYFVQHHHYGHDRAAGVFQGTDDEQRASGRDLLRRLGISHEEIATEDVLREYGQAAEVDPHTRRVIRTEPRRELRRVLHVTRQVEGMPVWSSHCQIGLTASRQIGFLELHWPLVPEAVIREAHRLKAKVSDGWSAPAIAAAEVESVEVGIIHTPAVGYFFDVHAAIRVIYRSLNPAVGRKPMYHLDRHGAPVLLRQASDSLTEATQGPRALFDRNFEDRAKQAMLDAFAPVSAMKSLARIVTDQEAAADPPPRALTADGARLEAIFARDGIVLGEHVSAATEALTRQWRPTYDISRDVFRDRLHFFGADRAGTGGPWVYSLTWGVIDGGTGGAGIGIAANLRDGTLSASHFTHGSNQLSAYSGIGMVIVPGQRCTLSVRPVVNWAGFDILSHRIFDPQLDPKGWGVAGGQLGLHVQSWDLAGGTFRDEGGKWTPLWQRSEINPSGQRSYNDTVDARDLTLDVLASSDRKYVIWVSCRALVITQAKFGLDIWASASVSCQIPYVVVEEISV